MGGSVILSLLAANVQTLARARHSVWQGCGIWKSAECWYLFSNSFSSRQKRLCDAQNQVIRNVLER